VGQCANDASLKDALVARVDAFMQAWEKQDAAALTATLAPEFLYVTSRGAAPREGVVGAPYPRVYAYELQPERCEGCADLNELRCAGLQDSSDRVLRRPSRSACGAEYGYIGTSRGQVVVSADDVNSSGVVAAFGASFASPLKVGDSG